MEKILRKILQKCKHIGCNRFSVDIDEHEANCEFAPSLAIKCPKCQEVVFTKDVLDHMYKHQKEPKDRGEIYIKLWKIFFICIIGVAVVKEIGLLGFLGFLILIMLFMGALAALNHALLVILQHFGAL